MRSPSAGGAVGGGAGQREHGRRRRVAGRGRRLATAGETDRRTQTVAVDAGATGQGPDVVEEMLVPDDGGEDGAGRHLRAQADDRALRVEVLPQHGGDGPPGAGRVQFLQHGEVVAGALGQVPAHLGPPFRGALLGSKIEADRGGQQRQQAQLGAEPVGRRDGLRWRVGVEAGTGLAR